MPSENFIAATRAHPSKTQNGMLKDVGVYIHEIQPECTIRSSFKKGSAHRNSLAANSSHIFVAQADKAIVNVYSREKGNLEALVSFPERVHSLATAGESIVAVGLAEGRIILWEVSTGKQVSTSAAHLQIVDSLAATDIHILSGSTDSNIHVWSIPQLLGIPSNETHEPLRCFSNHQAAITSLHNNCLELSLWTIITNLFATKIPLCLGLDPCDRAVFAGLEDGSVQMIEFLTLDSVKNPLYDIELQATPVQVKSTPWNPPTDVGSALAISLSYDGTYLLTGHESGKVYRWDTGHRRFSSQIVDFSSPVTNLKIELPFPKKKNLKICVVSKPKLTEQNYTLNSQFIQPLTTSQFDQTVLSYGFPREVLERAISQLSTTSHASVSTENQLKKENQELWKIINEQRAVQKATWDKYNSLRTGDT
ncbi:putative pre-rRNA-processing protein IPI3 [Blumeria hordei DH14]|uniref:Pre-rRNA-processing protein IPI3 n=1 Tax=Blumeria graminis f. sp. hordei (strain DH14) TaxID=546991 RepID=N1JQE9_BLUG1|nr:putative pre-rRNA-processing protein IPI3 [Blumeria hordei DH14]